MRTVNTRIIHQQGTSALFGPAVHPIVKPELFVLKCSKGLIYLFIDVLPMNISLLWGRPALWWEETGQARGKPTAVRRLREDSPTYHRKRSKHELDLNSNRFHLHDWCVAPGSLSSRGAWVAFRLIATCEKCEEQRLSIGFPNRINPGLLPLIDMLTLFAAFVLCSSSSRYSLH